MVVVIHGETGRVVDISQFCVTDPRLGLRQSRLWDTGDPLSRCEMSQTAVRSRRNVCNIYHLPADVVLVLG